MNSITPVTRRSTQQCLRQQCQIQSPPIRRALSTTQTRLDNLETQSTSSATQPPQPSSSAASQGTTRTLDPNTVSAPRLERKLFRETGKFPIGSRRRRAALTRTSSIPFEQLPYQCFQEARKVLITDRAEKAAKIAVQRAKINELLEAQEKGHTGGRETQLRSMRAYLEELKILADVNDPLVKKRHEDGMGDLNKPIYRYYLNRDWRLYKRRILMQRVTQLSIIPDVLPMIDPSVDLRLTFQGKSVQPGDKVNSGLTRAPPVLTAQVFDAGERLYTAVVIDSDVPDLETDGFKSRCHGIFTNLSIEPTKPRVELGRSGDTVLSWLPPHAQKGSPYHRLSIILLQHAKDPSTGQSIPMDPQTCKSLFKDREGLSLKSIMDKLSRSSGGRRLEAVGVGLFRTEWDESMEGVMRGAGIAGWDVEFKREKPRKLPYKKKDGARYR